MCCRAVVDLPSLVPQQDVHAPIPEPHSGLTDLSHPLFQSGLTGPARRVAVGLGVEADQPQALRIDISQSPRISSTSALFRPALRAYA